MKLKINILSIRKNTDPDILKLENVFIRRLKGTAAVSFCDLRSSAKHEADSEAAKHAEGQQLLKKISGTDFLIALDPDADQLTSENFAHMLQKTADSFGPEITFVIGGPFGLADDVLKKCNAAISLSKMTFTHEFARLILIEQIFRAAAIWTNSGYHK